MSFDDLKPFTLTSSLRGSPPVKVIPMRIPKPLKASDQHVYEVKLAVLAPPDTNPWTLLELAIVAMLKSGVTVVHGLNCAVSNVTSKSGGAYGPNSPPVVCTGFTGERMKTGMATIPALVVEIQDQPEAEKEVTA